MKKSVSGTGLQQVLTLKKETKQLKIPALLLQPIVENAIKFGLYDTIETVVINVCTKKSKR
ncbi:MAG: hypothetical protein WDM71_11895 [Ferruginibacter sp.]